MAYVRPTLPTPDDLSLISEVSESWSAERRCDFYLAKARVMQEWAALAVEPELRKQLSQLAHSYLMLAKTVLR